jgi:hypothetical protein
MGLHLPRQLVDGAPRFALLEAERGKRSKDFHGYLYLLRRRPAAPAVSARARSVRCAVSVPEHPSHRRIAVHDQASVMNCGVMHGAHDDELVGIMSAALGAQPVVVNIEKNAV